jgi:hypothetical protein
VGVVERADEDHYLTIAEKLDGGRLIPFLGAGANLCDRRDEDWKRGDEFLPSGAELAKYLATRGRYPLPGDDNLWRVSEYVCAEKGEDELYLYLRDVFNSNYATTSLHRLLARSAKLLNDAGGLQLLVVTTNYDDLVEQALAAEGLEFDVVWYEAKERSPTRGRFIHRAPGGEPTPIVLPDEYRELPEELTRPAVLKLHGCLDRRNDDDDSYVITEDSYIDYLALGDVGALIPVALRQRLANNSLLFLGYSLSDWNLRVVLNRIWQGSVFNMKSWAVQREPSDPNRSKIEQALWERRGIGLVYCPLSEYVRELDARLPRLPPLAPVG